MATLDDTGPLKWPAYSALDVARFAVAGRLFDVGFTYDQSARIVEHAVDPLLTPGVTPPPGFFAGLHLEFQPSAFGLVPGITRCRKAGAFSLHEIMSPVIRRLSLPIGRSAAAPEIGTRRRLASPSPGTRRSATRNESPTATAKESP